MEPYEQPTEETMKRFYDSLSEKDRRRYAGVEALRYGTGGRSYIAKVLGCSRRTVSKGAKEVSQLSKAEVDRRIRRPRRRTEVLSGKVAGHRRPVSARLASSYGR